ncbi:MAG TPA: hypothetical protein VFF06_12520 [Polyangia bacterium]|nr:hypothetical protein [Polyangia bacterium]
MLAMVGTTSAAARPPLELLSDPKRGVTVLVPDGWKLFAGSNRRQVRVFRERSSPAPRVYVVLDIGYDDIAAQLPPSTPATEALLAIVPDARPRRVGAWACGEEREGTTTYVHCVRPKEGTFSTLYFHGPRSVLTDIGGLAELVRIAESARGLQPQAAAAP